MKKAPCVLVIYTGGTIGMHQDPSSGSLETLAFEQVDEAIPELKKLDVELTIHAFQQPIDSSNVDPLLWNELTDLISANYEKYDGFVILHGTDTMAYTASALSFSLEHLNKPVILTGSQLPIGMIRTDGKENLVTAIEIAAAKDKSQQSIVREVAIYFEYKLYRGNRTHKYSAEHFDAFHSPNYPILAEAGVSIKYDYNALSRGSSKALITRNLATPKIVVLKLFPGIAPEVVLHILRIDELDAVVLETYGSGNAPTASWFIKALHEAHQKGVLLLNITQCNSGKVEQGRYETSAQLTKVGVIGGADMTTEAAVTKLQYLMAQDLKKEELISLLQTSLSGELTS